MQVQQSQRINEPILACSSYESKRASEPLLACFLYNTVRKEGKNRQHSAPAQADAHTQAHTSAGIPFIFSSPSSLLLAEQYLHPASLCILHLPSLSHSIPSVAHTEHTKTTHLCRAHLIMPLPLSLLSLFRTQSKKTHLWRAHLVTVATDHEDRSLNIGKPLRVAERGVGCLCRAEPLLAKAAAKL